MQKLHLVGFTTDQQSLILSARRGARSGSFQLTVDQELAESVEELRAKQIEAEAARVEAEAVARTARVESALSVREIQARLRQGRSVADIAKAAGVDPAWVDRFAAPVFAERAQVIARVQNAPLRRARLGPSAHPIGESIRRNLADRNVDVSAEELSEAWSARQLADGGWAVRFRYRHRNRDQVLRFDLDDANGTVVAADRTSGLLGYIAPATPLPASSARPRPTSPGPGERGPTKRATVTVGFRADDATGIATSPTAKERARANEAMRKAAAKAAAEAERAATRREKAKESERARREREVQAEEARLARERAAADRAMARERAAAERARVAAAKKKAVAAKKRAAERAKAKAEKQAADQARRAEAALLAAERKAAAARNAGVAKSTRAKDPPAKATTPAARGKAPAKAPAAIVPLFRPGSVEAADAMEVTPEGGEAGAAAPRDPGNGLTPERSTGERRTRPLRAT